MRHAAADDVKVGGGDQENRADLSGSFKVPAAEKETANQRQTCKEETDGAREFAPVASSGALRRCPRHAFRITGNQSRSGGLDGNTCHSSDGERVGFCTRARL